jgi:hypothetical protein
MRILAIFHGEYGRRHIENIQRHGPDHWQMATWQAPVALPPVIDYPEDYLPKQLPACDLILSFAEVRGVAELLPEIAQMTGAQAVLAAVDNEAWLPRGLARQLRGWLERIHVACATPKPLCSLTEQDYGVTRRERLPYDSPLIAEFARYFGQPSLQLTIDDHRQVVTAVELRRDAVCGCARFVAEGLLGLSIQDVHEKAGLLHHHFPCMASMGKDPDFGDTLMHVSGNIIKDEISEQIKPYQKYIQPNARSD